MRRGSRAVVGDERQGLVLCLQLTLFVEVQGLCAGGEGLDRSAGNLALAERELWVLVDKGTHDVEAVVGMLGAIDDRAAFDAHHTTVCLHLIISAYGTSLHVEMYLQLVALLPFAVDGVVAIFCYICSNSAAVYQDGIAEAFAIGILVKVRGYDLILNPTRDADLHGKLAGSILIDKDGDIAVPGVFRRLAQGHLLAAYGEVSFTA